MLASKDHWQIIDPSGALDLTFAYENRSRQTANVKPAPLVREWRRPSYWPFVVPALIVVLAVIIFPWLFTIWMSFNEWKVGSPTTFVGLANYLRLPTDPRFIEAVGHTLVYTALSVLLPLIFGTRFEVYRTRNFPSAAFCARSSSCR